MTATPRLAITELANNQATPEAPVNEAILVLEFFANGCHFKSRAASMAEPGTPAEGDAYLLTGTPTGTHWAGQGGKIALFYNGAWTFKTAKEGFLAWVDDEDVVVAFDGANWNSLATSGSVPTEASNATIWAGASDTSFVSPAKLFTSAAEVALTDGATITPDFNTGINFKVTVGGNRTLANPTNAKSGQSGLITVTQDGTGSRTLVYGTQWKFPGGAPALSTAAGAVDSIAYFVRADGTILASLAKAFS